MLKHIFHSLVLCAAATPALAGFSWDASIQRGLNVYDLEAGNGSITLTCDPDRVFGDTSNGSLQVSFAGKPAQGQMIVVDSKGFQASFMMKAGLVAQPDADEKEWSEMVRIFSEGGAFAFVTKDQSLTFPEVEKLSGLACG